MYLTPPIQLVVKYESREAGKLTQPRPIVVTKAIPEPSHNSPWDTLPVAKEVIRKRYPERFNLIIKSLPQWWAYNHSNHYLFNTHCPWFVGKLV